MRSNESLHGLYTCLNGFGIKFFLTANKTAAKQNISYLKLAGKSERSVIGKAAAEGDPRAGQAGCRGAATAVGARSGCGNGSSCGPDRAGRGAAPVPERWPGCGRPPSRGTARGRPGRAGQGPPSGRGAVRLPARAALPPVCLFV